MATQPVLNGLDTIELCPLKWLILCYVIFTWALKKNEEHTKKQQKKYKKKMKNMYITCMPIYL